MQILRQVLLSAALIALSGCSYFFGDEGHFRERTMDYQEANSIEPLQTPPEMASRQTRQRYPIPDVTATKSFVPEDSSSVPRPRSLANVDQDAGLELRRDEDLYWLIVRREKQELWPQLIDFVESNSFTVEVNDPQLGVIETGWLKPRRPEVKRGFWKSIGDFFTGGDEEKRERFRMSVEESAREPGSIVISIDHVKRESPVPDQVEWPLKPDDPELVRFVYEELMEYLGDEGRRQGTSVLSQDLKALPRYTMTRDGNDYPVLVINLDFNHAWLEVGQALALAKIPVQDLNRSLGIYYLQRSVVVPDEEEDEDVTRELQLRVIRAETGIQVAVQLDDDTVAPKDVSTEILTALSEKLR